MTAHFSSLHCVAVNLRSIHILFTFVLYKKCLLNHGCICVSPEIRFSEDREVKELQFIAVWQFRTTSTLNARFILLLFLVTNMSFNACLLSLFLQYRRHHGSDQDMKTVSDIFVKFYYQKISTFWVKKSCNIYFYVIYLYLWLSIRMSTVCTMLEQLSAKSTVVGAGSMKWSVVRHLSVPALAHSSSSFGPGECGQCHVVSRHKRLSSSNFL